MSDYVMLPLALLDDEGWMELEEADPRYISLFLRCLNLARRRCYGGEIRTLRGLPLTAERLARLHYRKRDEATVRMCQNFLDLASEVQLLEQHQDTYRMTNWILYYRRPSDTQEAWRERKRRQKSKKDPVETHPQTCPQEGKKNPKTSATSNADNQADKAPKTGKGGVKGVNSRNSLVSRQEEKRREDKGRSSSSSSDHGSVPSTSREIAVSAPDDDGEDRSFLNGYGDSCSPRGSPPAVEGFSSIGAVVKLPRRKGAAS